MKISLDESVKRIKNGETIAVPTDTVYGLACLHDDLTAISKIFSLKNRSPNKALILLISHPREITSFVSKIPPGAKELMDNFWPGALTIIFPTSDGSLGIRIPCCSMTLTLLKQTGPLFSTSANLSGNGSSLTPTDIEKTFGKSFPILENDERTHNVESTLITYEENEWRILREGAISGEEIKKRLTNFQQSNTMQKIDI